MLTADYAGYVRVCCTFNHGTDSMALTASIF